MLLFLIGLSFEVHLVKVFAVEIFQLGIESAELFFLARRLCLASLHWINGVELALLDQLGCLLN